MEYSRKESKAVKFLTQATGRKESPFTDKLNMMDGNAHGGLQGKSRVQSGTCQAWDAF